MEKVLIVVYLLVVVALIGVILLQRSEGGGLGMGSGNSGLMTVRGSSNILTRTTAILATLFFITAIGLSIIGQLDNRANSILDSAGTGAATAPTDQGSTTVLDALNKLQGEDSSGLNVPAPAGGADAGAAPAGATPAAPDSTAPEANSDLPDLTIPAPASGTPGTAGQ